MPSNTKRRSANPAISYSALPDLAADSPLPRRLLGVLLIAVGIAVLAAGFSWERFFPLSSYWNEAQATEYTAASLAVKVAADNPDRRPGQPDPPDLAAAKVRWQKAQDDLASAKAAQTRWPLVIICVGAVLTGGGLISLLNLPTKKR